jgi:hypothetical protein
VTFILQSEKSNIEGFDEWYEPWREKMKASAVMRWVVASRNRVVKQGDLDAKSVARATLIASYWRGEPPEGFASIFGRDGDQGIKASIDVPPSTPAAEQVKKLTELPNFFAREGFIELSRRWIDAALPDRELGDACAEAFGFMATMLDDLHTRLGLESGLVLRNGDDYVAVAGLPHGRLPCMITVDYDVQRLRLSDRGTDVGGRRYAFPPDPSDRTMLTKFTKKYGLSEKPPQDWDSVTAMASWCMSIARKILQKDGWHGWYVMLYKGNRQVSTEVLEARDRPDKIVLMEDLAAMIERSGIDGLVEIGDTWVGEIIHDEQGYIIAPAFQENRREALSVVAEDAYGNRRQLISPYRRAGKKIVFVGEPIDYTDSGFANSIQAVRDAWQRMGFSPKKANAPDDD